MSDGWGLVYLLRALLPDRPTRLTDMLVTQGFTSGALGADRPDAAFG